MTRSAPRWVCCQIGTREHYAVPRALHAAGCLERLITDAWVNPHHPVVAWAPARLRQRFHADLTGASVVAAGSAAAVLEPAVAWADPGGWHWRMWRNGWFQRRVVQTLDILQKGTPGARVLFAYSYAALQPFQFAKRHGWTTVLGQIDPGVAEERIVARLHAERPDLARRWRPAPPAYWRAWRTECDLADHVVVNSSWSADALRGEGIDGGKIHIVPLAYRAPAASEGFTRRFPEAFSVSRPMRVLFLGQVNLRKGMAEVFDAFAAMPDPHVVLDVVGALQLAVPSAARRDPRIRWHGAVTHSETARFYRDADVFLFPTHSDGFGLTQLEARAWRLPVIASRWCGAVVRDGIDGVRLAEVNGAALVAILRRLAASPSTLQAMSDAITAAPAYDLQTLADHLNDLPGLTRAGAA